ncbi:MAG: prephenate/arogenate dehydrogenase [Pseudanabaenaceae cyanobacterium bins.39]|nr:prephenate/arogenate dehydrogenase [Pseudanabaenaceae cyanobacterium bins.39]
MNIGIVGLGLIGGSLGRDLVASGSWVWGVSRSPDTCRQAEAIASVNVASPELANLDQEMLSQTEMVVICTPIAAILPTIAMVAPLLPKGCIITDVGSVKEAIVAEAIALCAPLGLRFVGSHPMAGTAFQSIMAAEANLFRDRPCVVTPSLDREAVDMVRSLWQSVGMRVYECTPAEHDRAVALISHLPVMVSASLIKTCQTEAGDVLPLAQNLASSGFRDTSRVGGGNPELGRLMAEYNQTALLRSLQAYQQSLQQVIDLVADGQWDALEDLLTTTQRDRELYL